MQLTSGTRPFRAGFPYESSFSVRSARLRVICSSWVPPILPTKRKTQSCAARAGQFLESLEAHPKHVKNPKNPKSRASAKLGTTKILTIPTIHRAWREVRVVRLAGSVRRICHAESTSHGHGPFLDRLPWFTY